MKKPIRTLLVSSLAALLGAVLLLGGAGSLAFWSDTTSTTQDIQTGSLDLGTIGTESFAAATIIQCNETTCSQPVNYTGGAIVPGDVINVTVNVPVKLVGQNLKAELAVTPTKVMPTEPAADVALSKVVSIGVSSINGKPAAGSTTAKLALTPSTVTNGTVPVVLVVKFPWGKVGDSNAAMGGKVTLGATYSLTQIAAG
ncbi:alternate-type signal peptide domain-containing protein [Mycetocola zhadangensis]|uniref:Alternate-type signal peptide domain-containing protein n=1 Tax=Mycetocola zhadangensis TaxID=1164595 RepID=A0A3L7J2I3_9MICO|nr:alternate-type signal peptide domain-containing protein [Mycetocola zhadangensis]RLQ84475.1 alternate-type signal peptide domain-containing protein [Mycetocola zhadangensis]GGE92677.1 hypothetical protein GCM10011313_14550 [Mycetocola zhadangensis]